MLLSPPLEKVTDTSKGKQDMFEKGLGTIYRLCEVYGHGGWIKMWRRKFSLVLNSAECCTCTGLFTLAVKD